jgi:hypothetical protein
MSSVVWQGGALLEEIGVAELQIGSGSILTAVTSGTGPNS